MTTYAVFDRDAKEVPAVVPDRFSWFAALLPPIFAIAHGLWLELVGWVLVIMLLDAATIEIGGEADFGIYVVFAIWIGFEASTFRHAAMLRRGWRHRTDVIASGADMAQLEGLRGRTPQ